MKIITSIPMGGKAVPMQARSRYYPRLADAKLLLRLTACKSLSTEARLSVMRMVHALILFNRSDAKFAQICL